jgi:hypothetical protein
MWPVYLLSIFVEGAWAWFPRVDAWGTRQCLAGGEISFGVIPVWSRILGDQVRN